jgi:hypothetical protein
MFPALLFADAGALSAGLAADKTGPKVISSFGGSPGRHRECGDDERAQSEGTDQQCTANQEWSSRLCFNWHSLSRSAIQEL